MSETENLYVPDRSAEEMSMIELLVAESEKVVAVESGQVPPPADEGGAPETHVESDTDDGGASDVGSDELEDAMKLQVPLEEEQIHGFVGCDTVENNMPIRRLHFVGNCGKTPGVHYAHFSVWGDEVPEDHEFDRRCIRCFGRERPLVDAPHRASESESDSDSSSDST